MNLTLFWFTNSTVLNAILVLVDLMFLFSLLVALLLKLLLHIFPTESGHLELTAKFLNSKSKPISRVC